MTPTATASDQTLRDVIEQLAPLERGDGMPGEREAAELLRDRFAAIGCPVQIDEETYDRGYARLHAGFAAVGALSALLALRGRARGLAALAGAAAAAAARRRLGERDPLHPARDRGTGHHHERGRPGRRRGRRANAGGDGPPRRGADGLHLRRPVQRKLHEHFPDFIERTDTALPLWWPIVAGPA